MASYSLPIWIYVMLWVFIGLLGGFAFVFLTRLYWADAANRPERGHGSAKESEKNASTRQPIVTIAIITLALALVVMIATGRLHWLSAALTGAIPFLRRGASLLRYAPLLQRLFPGVFTKSHAGQSGPKGRTTPANSRLTKEQARAMLEVPHNATTDQIVAAHRRLMAKNHPDRGGSNYIAAQLNEAKDLLMQGRSRT